MSSRRRISGAVLAVATWGLLAVSCGGGEVSREEYGTELRAAMAELEEAYGDAGEALAEDAGSTTNERVEQLRTSQIALRDAGNRLDSIAPPEELADDHESLVAGVRDMADAVDLLIEAQELETSNPTRAQELAREFATDTSFGTVEAAASRISRAGVDAGL